MKLVIVCGLILLALIVTPRAEATSANENKRIIKGYAKDLNLDAGRALKIAKCESGYNEKAKSPPYHGLFQLEKDEYRTFQHQGKRKFDRMFRRHSWGIYSAKGNALATLVHVKANDWGFIGSCD